MPEGTKNMFSFWSSKSFECPNVSNGLKTCYKKILRPLEEYYLYDQFYSSGLEESDFNSKPIVLLIGQYSTGKTTLVRYLLGEDFPGIRIGPEPTTEKFNIIMKGSDERIIPGNALVMDPKMPFRSLESFGNSFLNRLQKSLAKSPILNSVSVVDTPGILSGQKQNNDRGYDFTKVLQWFASRVDRILIMFDAHKLDISDDLRDAIVALKDYDDKIRILLNKSDSVESQELMRVYGALMWSLGKVFNTPEVVRVYIGSFWDHPLKSTINRQLFEKEEEDLLQDLKSLPQQSTIRKLNDFIKRARHVKIHGLIISELAKNIPMFGRDKKKKDLLQNLESIYSKVQTDHHLFKNDLPDINQMREKLRNVDWSLFKGPDRKLNEKVDKMLSKDMSQLIKIDSIDVNDIKIDINSNDTPFKAIRFKTRQLGVNITFQQPKKINGSLLTNTLSTT
ncbi:EH domain-containing protein 3 isoform X2 [Lepeophtheirus salmonis]|uniref:EH domain-containing protein 3 isoform X2 n=1 Tax=Lepeophtheirus salmonis TaxID=72036 RepID=UPI003AF38258